MPQRNCAAHKQQVYVHHMCLGAQITNPYAVFQSLCFVPAQSVFVLIAAATGVHPQLVQL
jgi:hypothetical protein